MIYFENVVKILWNNTFFFLIPLKISVTTIFFSSHFRQWHCHNCHKFSPLFRQWHCHNWFPFGHPLALAHFEHFTPTRSARLGNRKIIEIQNFISPTFSLSLSYFCQNFSNTIVEIHSLFSIP